MPDFSGQLRPDEPPAAGPSGDGNPQDYSNPTIRPGTGVVDVDALPRQRGGPPEGAGPTLTPGRRARGGAPPVVHLGNRPPIPVRHHRAGREHRQTGLTHPQVDSDHTPRPPHRGQGLHPPVGPHAQGLRLRGTRVVIHREDRAHRVRIRPPLMTMADRANRARRDPRRPGDVQVTDAPPMKVDNPPSCLSGINRRGRQPVQLPQVIAGRRGTVTHRATHATPPLLARVTAHIRRPAGSR